MAATLLGRTDREPYGRADVHFGGAALQRALDVARKGRDELGGVASRVPAPGERQQAAVAFAPQRIATATPPGRRARGSGGRVRGADQLRSVELAERPRRGLLPSRTALLRRRDRKRLLAGAVLP